MKSIFVNTLIAASFFLCYTPTQAQNSSAKTDQATLIKQFVGQWTAVIGQDSIMFTEFTAFGNGLEGKSRLVSGSKILREGRQMFGYDPKTDTFTEAEMSTNSDVELWSCWFVTNQLLIGVPFENLAKPSEALYKIEVLIQSPDSFVQSVFKNGTLITQKTMNRVNNAK